MSILRGLTDIDVVCDWIHKTPSIKILTMSGIPLHAHVSFLFLSAFIIALAGFNPFTIITLSIGWFTSLTTSLSHFVTVRACGGLIEKDVIWPLGGISPCSMENVPRALRLISAVSGPMLLFPYFMIYFLIGGGNLEFILGGIAPGAKYSFFEAVFVWAASLMLWLMAMNFLFPLHPLTGFELLRHSIGRFVSRQALVTTALVISTPMTLVFLWHGTMHGPNLLQLWLGIWAVPQLIQMSLALSKNSVDHLPFFAGEAIEADVPITPLPLVGAVVPAEFIGKGSEDWPSETQTATNQVKLVQLKNSTGLKLPPGTYTIEDSAA